MPTVDLHQGIQQQIEAVIHVILPTSQISAPHVSSTLKNVAAGEDNKLHICLKRTQQYGNAGFEFWTLENILEFT